MNTIESLKSACRTEGWNGYDAKPIPDKVFDRASDLIPYLPKYMELFPVASGSLQFESKDADFFVEIFEDKYEVEDHINHTRIELTYTKFDDLIYYLDNR